MNFPKDLKYSKEHTWIRMEGESGIIGITDFAQSQLGEIVYVDLPSVGNEFGIDEAFGSVEALKTVSDLFMPISGEIIEINEVINDRQESVNEKPYTDGWLIKIKPSNPVELSNLLDADSYENLTDSN